MNGKRIPVFIIAGFVLGTCLLIYIHFVFSKNNDMLIQGNEKLMGEVRVNSQLKDLEISIITIDSRVRSKIIHNDTAEITNLKGVINYTEGIIDQLQKIADDSVTSQYVDDLDTLTRRKVIYSEQLLDSLHVAGQASVRRIIRHNYGSNLTDSILLTLHKIENRRKANFDDANDLIKEGSEKAQKFITLLIGFVLVGGALLFWFIINTIRRQGLLIDKLHKSESQERESALVKEKFLANMSHEIRTPLNAIIGFANLLQKKDHDEESKEYVDAIQKSGENLLIVVNDILDLSKIEAGMLRIESFPFSIRSVVQSVKLMFSEDAIGKGIHFSTMVDEKLPDRLIGDGNRLSQILINLIGNALKFTEAGSVSLQISNGGINGDFVDAVFDVKDTGIGIEKEKLEKIFSRFQQADDAVTRKFGGTGLGLSIASELIHLQHGKIEVESERGQGSAFHMLIPYKIADGEPQPDLPIEEQLEKPLLKNIKILVAEDNSINQSLIRHLFSLWNVPCDIVSNGIEALEKLKKETYNLILMDIQMPEMDGYSATRAIRENLKMDVPVIAMTAHALSGEKEKCLASGMNDYISKPIRENQLLALIKQFTENISDNEKKVKMENNIASGYKLINLDYLGQISGGDHEFEKKVTKQFIELMPGEITKLKNAWANKDLYTLKRTAHSLKSTISVMGLNNVLQSCLDSIEGENLSDEGYEQNIDSVESICATAIAESKKFYATL